MISFLLFLFLPSTISAFVSTFSHDVIAYSNLTPKMIQFRVDMVGNGGQGWRNDDFLSSLGSDEEDRERVTDEYNDFKKSRESFQKRQMERMNSPEFKKFQEQQISRQLQRQENDSDGGFFDDIGFFQETEESRFGNMMRQTEMKKRMGMNDLGSGYGIGFEQKFGVPLDDDFEDDETV
jgi:hypothetical protein